MARDVTDATDTADATPHVTGAAGVTARSLLAAARRAYDAPGSPLPAAAERARWSGFAGGGRWMAAALGVLRGNGNDARGDVAPFAALGIAKYAAATAAAIVPIAAAVLSGHAWVALLAVPTFYAVEVQMLFLFPLAIDGSRRPWRDSRAWTVQAGGTIPAMRVVVPIAAHMLLGGLRGGGFVRSWCTGCLAVCIWYERLRVERDDSGAHRAETRSTQPARVGFELGARRPLFVRRESVRVGLPRPLTVLYASDLHLGRPWTRAVAAQLARAVRDARPDVILLGGDLADTAAGLPPLGRLVRALAGRAPVLATAGNHDRRAGLDAVRAAVIRGGGTWLNDGSPAQSLTCGASTIAISSDPTARRPADAAAFILCAHDPAASADVGANRFDLVLAGHLHGGQCVLWERGGRLYPGAWINRWTGLRFPRGRGTLLVVSRGAGDTLPLRLNCPREVLLCTIA